MDGRELPELPELPELLSPFSGVFVSSLVIVERGLVTGGNAWQVVRLHTIE